MKQHFTQTLCIMFIMMLLAPSVTNADDDLRVDFAEAKAYKGEEIQLRATITGGKAPFIITWYDNMMKPFFNDISEVSRKITAKITATRTCDLTVEVTDADGRVASDLQRLFVNTIDAPTATFEDVYLGGSTYTGGAYFKVGASSPMSGWDTSFVSGGFIFHSLASQDGTCGSGIACTNVLADDFVPHNPDVHYATVAEYPLDGSRQYATITDSAYIDHAGVFTSPHPFSGFYITSSAEFVRSVVDGSDLSPEFTDGDYAFVNICDEITGRSVDYYLADFRPDNLNERYLIRTWQWVDLRSLGMVSDRLKMTFHSSRTPAPGATGFCMPGMFCIDDFNGTLQSPVQPVQNIESGQRILLSQFLPQPNNGAAINYSIYDVEGAYSDDARFEIDAPFLKVTASQCNVRVTVKEISCGEAYYATIPVVISGEQKKADFESLTLNSHNYVVAMGNIFTDGSYRFVSDTCTVTGFGYSALYGPQALPITRYHAAQPGGGYNHSDVYAVLSDSACVYSMTPDKPISGFYVANSQETYSNVLEGYDYLKRPFEQGDSLVLTVVNPDNGAKVSYALADYRSENTADHYCLETWQWVDLRSLGNVSSLRLYLTSSQMLEPGESGYNLEPQCCIDDFGGSREIRQCPAVCLTPDEHRRAEIPLKDYFSFSRVPGGATTTYIVDEIKGAPEQTSVYVDGDRLCFEVYQETPFSVIVSATCHGVTLYADIPVTFASDIDTVFPESVAAEYFTIDGMSIGKSAADAPITIVRNADGSVRKILTK